MPTVLKPAYGRLQNIKLNKEIWATESGTICNDGNLKRVSLLGISLILKPPAHLSPPVSQPN